MPNRRATVENWSAHARRSDNAEHAKRMIRLRTTEGGVVLGFGAHPPGGEELANIWGTTTEGGWEVQLHSADYQDILHLLQTEEPINIFVKKDDDMRTTFFELRSGRDEPGGGFTDV